MKETRKRRNEKSNEQTHTKNAKHDKARDIIILINKKYLMRNIYNIMSQVFDRQYDKQHKAHTTHLHIQ